MSTSHTPFSNVETNNLIFQTRLNDLNKLLEIAMQESINSVTQSNQQFLPIANELLDTMSKITSELSALLINTKSFKKKAKENQVLYENLNTLAGTLGNLQFKLNRIIINIDQVNKYSQSFKEEYKNLLGNISKHTKND